MPRVANNTDALMKDLMSRLEKLVETARKEGRDEALSEIRSLVDGGGRGRGKAAVAGGVETDRKPRKKSKKPRKNPWANMTPEQKKERVRKMLAGRGLKPKDER
jgi:hypothetical protein